MLYIHPHPVPSLSTPFQTFAPPKTPPTTNKMTILETLCIVLFILWVLVEVTVYTFAPLLIRINDIGEALDLYLWIVPRLYVLCVLIEEIIVEAFETVVRWVLGTER